tara:strand:+ start:19 stop:285 length:267 start_codon:yes stop_codon:yes gene_type:complete
MNTIIERVKGNLRMVAKPTESITFKKHFNNVMDYCEKDETNADIPLYESVAYLKGYIKGMERAYEDWAKEQSEAQEMIKNDICLQRKD